MFATIAFIAMLGFLTRVRMGDYAYFRARGGAEDPRGAGRARLRGWGRDRFAYDVDVRDVDAIHAELKPRLDTLPEGDVHRPPDKAYGQRELLIRLRTGSCSCSVRQSGNKSAA